jgi:glycosyltransferase involved in cell wall biosynthesis
MRVVVATDAWDPQVNGVVRTLEQLVAFAPQAGGDIRIVHPGLFRTVPMPGYPEIRLAVATAGEVAKAIMAHSPDSVHVSTEGPVGFMARRFCLSRGLPFTTCYHTAFPQYVSARAPIPERAIYAALRWFHNAGNGTMVATQDLEDELREHGFTHLMRWGRGVDASLFRPRPAAAAPLPKPVFLYVGRVAVEKNIEAFLRLELSGTKVVVGDGPALEDMRAAFPDAVFRGRLEGDALAEAYASADVFVFPSQTDTFGLVLLEALASGVPVATFRNAGGFARQVAEAGCGVADDDLGVAASRALSIPKQRCRDFALGFSLQSVAAQFLANVALAENRTSHAA